MPVPDEKLSVRKSQVIARFLSEEGGKGRIAASACLYRTPTQVAQTYLGSKASKASVEELVKKINARLGIPAQDEV